jgi:hypothetical protein
MKKNLITLLILMMIFSGCSTQGKLKEYNGTKIIFGRGGGYSGQEYSYTLYPDGNITLYDNISGQQTKITRLTKKKTVDLFEKMDQIMLPGIEFNHPGTEYYFIRQVRKNKTQNIVWGARRPQIPERYSVFYDSLMLLVRQK